MAHALVPHPETPGPDIAIHVEVERTGCGDIAIAYLVTGAVDQIKRPAQSHSPQRMDELWQATCFEAFLKPDGDEAYVEVNLSPSLNWAAYSFTGYRERMNQLELPQPPAIIAPHTGGTLFLGADLTLSGLLFPPPHAVWRIALSAVIEETRGRKSYWALSHPAGKPDFHAPEAFALHLDAPEHAH